MQNTLQQLADDARAAGVQSVTLFAPAVRYRSTNNSEFSPCMDWAAELWLIHSEPMFTNPVLAGVVRFLTLRLGEQDIAPMLAALPGAGRFANLFGGRWLSDEVEAQFHDVEIDSAVLVTDAVIATPLRGHDLGPWMVADVIYRMLNANGAALVASTPSFNPSSTAADFEASERITAQWRKAGFSPIRSNPVFSGLSTASASLKRARDGLAHIADSKLSLSIGTLKPCEDLNRIAAADDL
ncbi:MAG: hypothetical protein WA988_02180 [Candidatus Nanopelagicales bacterium]